MHNNNIYLYWVGKEYKLIKILKKFIYLHSKNGRAYKVHLINKNNIHNYIKNVPDCFYKLQPSHQADFVRVSVICDYGGIWMDLDTLVMNDMHSMFNILNKQDGFFIKENNDKLSNGVFGSRPNTLLMQLWKKKIITVLNSKQNTINWTEIGSSVLEKIKVEYPEYYYDYVIFNGLDAMYPVNWDKCVEEFINKPYENYKTLIRPKQPFIILVNSVYKELEPYSTKDIMNMQRPLNYFMNKSIINYVKKLEIRT
jgi:hypothetical protein